MMDILKYFPPDIAKALKDTDFESLQEIRLRYKKPLTIKIKTGIYFLTAAGKKTKNASNAMPVTDIHIKNTVELLCCASVYAYEEEIKQGYITTKEGHRAGLCGNVVCDNGKITFINNITGINFRVAHEVFGAADKVLSAVYNNADIKNTLVISPPGMGKTTLIRDLARRISNREKNISIVDERCEIAAHNRFDTGLCTDVLSGAEKAQGVNMMLRSMSPEVIVTDEIGTESDFKALKKALSCGVKIITTVHAKNIAQIKRREDFSQIMEMFDVFITLSDKNGIGTVEELEIR